MTTTDLARLDRDLALALAIADEVDAFTLPRFAARDFSVDWKQNRTEVTEIDRDAESMIASSIRNERTDHAVFGEEHGLDGDPDSPWRWVLDPIDGTSGYVRGIPIWATLIALTHVDHGAVLGVVSAPALGRRWFGGHGLGAQLTALGTTREISVSSVGALTDAQVSVTHNSGWDRLGRSDALVEFQNRARRSRGIGDFWQHMMVADGTIDVAIDAVGVAAYDIAALLPIVEAAGGRLTDRHGVATHEHDTAVTSNGLLHEEALAAVAPEGLVSRCE
ncbi:MAG: inositol monophosphatase family protein [Actinomycetota bacterium]